MGLKHLAKIVSERDGITMEEAMERVEECAEEVNNNPYDAEDLLAYHLGLELDYIFDILF